jgi:hypothetical protein
VSRFHFRLRSLMAVPICVGLALWCAGSVEGCGGHWARGIGFRSIPLDFLIVDADDGRPISSATIRTVDAVPETLMVTGRDGHAGFVFLA